MGGIAEEPPKMTNLGIFAQRPKRYIMQIICPVFLRVIALVIPARFPVCR